MNDDNTPTKFLYSENKKYMDGLIAEPVNKAEILRCIEERKHNIKELRQHSYGCAFLSIMFGMGSLGIIILLVINLPGFLPSLKENLVVPFVGLITMLLFATILFRAAWILAEMFFTRPQADNRDVETIYQMFLQNKQLFKGMILGVYPQGEGYLVRYMPIGLSLSPATEFKAHRMPDVKAGDTVTIIYWEGYVALI